LGENGEKLTLTLMKNFLPFSGICAIIALGLCGCSTFSGPKPDRAIAELNPTQGNKAHGTVTFTKVSDGVRVVADIYDLTPGPHGIHLHEKGDCSAPDGSSAGGHFNPANMPHGGPKDVRRHVGDFGNIVADSDGHARIKFVEPLLTFQGDSSIIGRSVVVHEKADDMITQPTGDSGARVACGVIQKVVEAAPTAEPKPESK
jgi:Cu-Zn family superoxide dismutase